MRIKVIIYPEYLQMYSRVGHPLGKSIKGFKKWLKYQLTNILKEHVGESNKQIQRLL